jgi:hypothetical protein
VYWNLLFQCFLIAQHVSGDTPLTIRSSKIVIAASGFTYVFGCRPLGWQRPATKQLIFNHEVFNLLGV